MWTWLDIFKLWYLQVTNPNWYISKMYCFTFWWHVPVSYTACLITRNGDRDLPFIRELKSPSLGDWSRALYDEGNTPLTLTPVTVADGKSPPACFRENTYHGLPSREKRFQGPSKCGQEPQCAPEARWISVFVLLECFWRCDFLRYLMECPGNSAMTYLQGLRIPTNVFNCMLG